MKLEGGTIAEDVVMGSGAAAKPGKHVGVYYVGRTAHNNKVRGPACIGEWGSGTWVMSTKMMSWDQIGHLGLLVV
jgi:hypothetical protein